MRLMQKGLKGNHDNAPLSAARQRVKYSWKALKQSLYFSLNTKSKSHNDANGGENSKQFDLHIKDEPDISVDSLVDQNIKSFLAESDDYDDIAELFEKYQYERDAFDRLKNKLHQGDVASEFSEISSISELSLSSESDGDADTVISAISNADLRFATDVFPSRRSTLDGHDTSSSSKTASTCSSKTETTLPVKESPSRRSNTPKSRSNEQLAPPERTRAVLKPLPSLMRPSFVPDISNFNDIDLSNVVIAHASSEISKRKTSGNKEVTKVVNRDLNGVEVNKIVKHDNDTKCSLEDFEIDDDISNVVVQCTSTPNNVSHNKGVKAELDTVPKNNCLPLMQLFNKKNDTKATKNVNSNDKLDPDNVTSVNCKISPQYTSDNDTRLHNTIPRYKSENYFTANGGNIGECRKSSSTQTVDDGMSNQLMRKPLNISRSTMEKYPHIFANYLALQENAFHSLPNLTRKREMSQQNLTAKETNSERMASLNSITSAGTPPSTENIIMRHFKDADVSMVDENYFIVYPEMSEDTLICGNPPCSKKQIPGKHGQDKFTSCPSCFICYCSRTCRHCHWPEHKETCLVGFVNFYVHTFFRRCEKDIYINEYLRNLAHGAYQTFGRGCVMIRFQSPTDIEYNAATCGLTLSTQPVYKSFKTVLNENRPHRHLHVLCQNIKDYDPDQEFVLSIFVWIGEQQNSTENICTAVVRSARISMMGAQKAGFGDSILPYSIRTFSLPTSLNLVDSTESDIETRRYYCKEIAFGLKRYGVHLKSEYPEAYEKLYRYIDQGILFTPIILYGKRNNRNYKCILYSGKVEKTSGEYYGAGAFV